MFIARENEQFSSVEFETKEKDLYAEKKFFSLDTIETDVKILRYEDFFGSNDVKFPFARGEKNL